MDVSHLFQLLLKLLFVEWILGFDEVLGIGSFALKFNLLLHRLAKLRPFRTFLVVLHLELLHLVHQVVDLVIILLKHSLGHALVQIIFLVGDHVPELLVKLIRIREP